MEQVHMQKMFVVKTGTTFPDTLRQLGDFDTWTKAAMGETALEVHTLDVENGAALPAAADCAGVVITGAHAMVTDDLPWSVAIERWIPSLLEAEVPLFGICYGHQLLARAAGGEVGFHPQGKEIGTVEVKRLGTADLDILFKQLPISFPAHVTHAQTVLTLPPGATRLAANGHEPNHAFRLGTNAWGVQFHPEYSTDIMRAYIREQADELTTAGRDVAGILESVGPTQAVSDLLTRFARLAAEEPG